VRTGRGELFPRIRHVDQVNRPTGASGEEAFLAGTAKSVPTRPCFHDAAGTMDLQNAVVILELWQPLTLPPAMIMSEDE